MIHVFHVSLFIEFYERLFSFSWKTTNNDIDQVFVDIGRSSHVCHGMFVSQLFHPHRVNPIDDMK